jgi:hypothetical protein
MFTLGCCQTLRRDLVTATATALLLSTSAPAVSASNVPGLGIYHYADLCRSMGSGDLYGRRVVLLRLPEGDSLVFEQENELMLFGSVHIDSATGEISFMFPTPDNKLDNPIVFQGTVMENLLTGTVKYRGGAGGEDSIKLSRRRNVQIPSC